MIVGSTGAIASSTPVQDSFSNAYTLKSSGTAVFGGIFMYAYVCDGASGGAGTIATANFAASSAGAVYFIEITGAANPGFDVQNTINNSSASTTPSGASVTTTNAADLILSLIYSSNAATITNAGGFNAFVDKSNAAAASSVPNSAVSYQIESTTGAYSDSYVLGASDFSGGLTIALKQGIPAVGVPIAWLK